MRDRLMELIQNAPRTDTVYGDIKLAEPVQTLQTIADDLLDNGVIVPPCKVGELLYVAIEAIPEYEVLSFSIREQGLLIQTHSKFTGGLHPIWACRIGKDVFLTREEAEKALAERIEG